MAIFNSYFCLPEGITIWRNQTSLARTSPNFMEVLVRLENHETKWWQLAMVAYPLQVRL